MNDRIATIGIVALTACVIALTLDHFFGPREPTQPTALKSPAPLSEAMWTEVISSGHARGERNAPWVLVEFGDYQCPACRAAVARIESFLQRHEADVGFVYRHWPLPYHPHARPAALAAECAAASGRFWEMHNALYEHQASLGLTSYETIALQAGVKDTTAFRSCLQDQNIADRVDVDAKLAVSVGGRGTPTLVLNGEFITIAMLDSLDAVIRSARPPKPITH